MSMVFMMYFDNLHLWEYSFDIPLSVGRVAGIFH
jgi:hypothetical protein